MYGVFTHIVGIVCPRSACQCSSSVNTKGRPSDEIPGSEPWARKMKEFERYPVQCNTHRVPVYTQNIVPIISSPPSPARTIQPVCEERVPMPQSACGEKHRACGVKTIDIFNHRNILENKKLNIFPPKYFASTSQRKCQNIFFKHFIPSVSLSQSPSDQCSKYHKTTDKISRVHVHSGEIGVPSTKCLCFCSIDLCICSL